jgi:cysteine synthase A
LRPTIVMPRARRVFVEGGICHVYNRVTRGERVFADYGERQAAVDHERHLLGAGIDHVLELSYWDRKRLHNLKYFTWVEQQGKTVEELDAQWEDPNYWTSKYHAWQELDERIRAFNERVGLVGRYR